MEELNRLAKIYYQNTVNNRYINWTGKLCSVSALVFFLLSMYVLSEGYQTLFLVPLGIGLSLSLEVKKSYNKNLVSFLSKETGLYSDNVDCQKAAYLQKLVCHIDNSLFDVMKKFKEIRETARSEHTLSTKSELKRFFHFVYNPDAKNRILSLFIYLISLIAFITIPRGDGAIGLYNLLNEITLKSTLSYLTMIIIFIVILYCALVLPIVYIYKFNIIPLLLKLSSTDILSRFFISELAKYAYFEKVITIDLKKRLQNKRRTIRKLTNKNRR